MTEISIHRATYEDLPAIVALQHAAYAGNHDVIGVVALPLQADYDEVFAHYECWIAGDGSPIAGALILELRPDDLLIWSVATHPDVRSSGLGNRLLAVADRRAHETGRTTIRLYTHEKLTRNIAWYGRQGFAIERIEEMPDRRAVHMKKELEDTK